MPFLAGLSRQPQVLVVDDSPEDRVMLRRYLTRDQTPCDVIETASIKEALEQVARHLPDCVLLDFNLMDGDGLTLLRRLVATYGSHAFGLVMLTASGDTGIAVEALKSGAHDYIEKSGLTPAALRRTVGNVLEKAAYQRQLSQQRSALAEKNDELAARLGQLDREIEERNRVERALKENEAFLQSIITANADCVKVVSLDGRLEWMNDNGQAMMEVADYSKIHRFVWADWWVTAEGRREALMALEVARAGGVGRFSGVCSTMKGQEKWWDVIITPIFDVARQPEKFLIVSRDITPARRGEEIVRAAEKQLRVVTDHLPVHVAQFDRDGRYRFANRILSTRFNLLPGEIIGKHISEVVGPESYQALQPYMERALRGENVEFETFGSGNLIGRWLRGTFIPERDATGVVVGFVAVSTDITASKQAQADLEKARDQAIAASQARDIFLAALSHELRTPLNPVLLIASDAAQNTVLAPAVRADFASIVNHVELEARLIDDLLDLSRISHGKLPVELQATALQPTIRDAIKIMQPELQAKKIGLAVDLGPDEAVVQGDAVRLQQMVWNLLKNAVKFTPEGGKVTVSLRVEPAAGEAWVHVSDSGIGISTDDLPRIFQAFSQGKHIQNGEIVRLGGLGLGLAITRMLVELHGGEINAESGGAGQGSTFTIRLPLIGKSPEAPPTRNKREKMGSVQSATPVARSPVQILLVEDHESTRTTMTALLQKRGFGVITASSIEEAVALAVLEPFDVLVSDLGLPDGNGYDLLKKILAVKPNVQAIALSGYGAEEDITRSLEAGFSAHITKPVRIDMLLAALSRLP